MGRVRPRDARTGPNAVKIILPQLKRAKKLQD